MFKNKISRLVVVLFTLVTIGVNFLAVALPLNGRTTQSLSDQYPVAFVPAGYVFSIWSLIYIGLIVYAFFQLRKNDKYDSLIDKITPAHIVGLVANAAWIFAWHYEFVPMSVVIMLVLLFSLIFIYQNIQKVKGDNKFNISVKLPFSIYLGWITVATIANITVLLYSLGIKELVLSGVAWASVLMLIAGILGAIAYIRNKDIAYDGVIIWSLIGIMVKFNTNSTLVLAGVLAITLIVIGIAYRNTKINT